MAREAEHQQVRLGIVAAAEDADPVVDVQLPVGARDAADLAAAAARGDQAAPPGGVEWNGA